jgi:hypothetical protein
MLLYFVQLFPVHDFRPGTNAERNAKPGEAQVIIEIQSAGRRFLPALILSPVLPVVFIDAVLMNSQKVM